LQDGKFYKTIHQRDRSKAQVPVSIKSDHDNRWSDIAWKEVSNAHNLGRSRKKSKLIGLEIIQETTDKIVQIKEGLKTARDRQKSYVDNRQSR
ncbi:hypothetical protein Tco_1152490, partial [Tanacetum coccineum]